MTIRSLIRSPIRKGVRSLIGGDRPVIIDGLMFFTDGTVMQFTDNTVIYFGD